jgi:hypothetical protein
MRHTVSTTKYQRKALVKSNIIVAEMLLSGKLYAEVSTPNIMVKTTTMRNDIGTIAFPTSKGGRNRVLL